MLANTLTLTVNAVPVTLTRVNQDNYGSVYTYKGASEAYSLQIRNSVEKSKVVGVPDIERHNAFLEHTVYATPTAAEKYNSVTTTIRARIGNDPAKVGYDAVGFNTLVGSILTSLIAGES